MVVLTSPPELVTQLYKIFLGHLDLLLDKSDNTFKNKYVLPMMGRCVSCGVKDLMTPVLNNIVSYNYNYIFNCNCN